METINSATSIRVPWNKGKLVGQKAPFKLKEIWAIRVRLQIASRCRELVLFNLAVDSKLRACDLVQLRVCDVCHGQSMASRALTDDFLQAEFRNHPICPPDYAPELLIPGFNYWGWTQRATARIRYGGRKRR